MKVKILKIQEKQLRTQVITFLAYWNEVKPENERVKNTESLEKVPKKELNELLANFWPNAKKQNGDSYKKSGEGRMYEI